MDLSEARELLKDTARLELRDHAFGDREVTWTKKDGLVAEGYFGGGDAGVWFTYLPNSFEGDDARTLLECGTLIVARNDQTGPKTFVESKVMPGLTKEAVLDELTKEN